MSTNCKPHNTHTVCILGMLVTINNCINLNGGNDHYDNPWVSIVHKSQYCTPLQQQLHWLPVPERIKYKTACVTMQSQVPLPLSFWAATPLQSFPLSPLFVRHTRAQNPTLQPQNPWLLHFLTLWPPHLEQSPPRHQALCYSLFLRKPTQDISLLRIFQLNHIVLHA